MLGPKTSRLRRALVVRSLSLLALLVLAASVLPAQHSRVVSGRVVLQRAGRVEPVVGRIVTLHRVGSDTAGPVDSVRSDGRGHYRFTFQPFGAEGAVYFAAALHGGVAYFTQPLGAEATEGESADITVFDTASTGIDISVRGRHLAISGPSASGNRAVVDVFELGNDSLRTLVGSAGRPSWRMPLPEGALNASVMRDAGDIAGAAVVVADGQAAVFAPFAPGLKQLALRYELGAALDSLTIPVLQPTGVLELLLEEENARVTGAGVVGQGTATVEGRSLQRYLAHDVASNAVLTITLPALRDTGGPPAWLLVLLGALVAAVLAATLLYRSRRRETVGSVAAGEERT